MQHPTEFKLRAPQPALCQVGGGVTGLITGAKMKTVGFTKSYSQKKGILVLTFGPSGRALVPFKHPTDVA